MTMLKVDSQLVVKVYWSKVHIEDTSGIGDSTETMKREDQRRWRICNCLVSITMFNRKDRMTPSNSNIVGGSNHQSGNHLEKQVVQVPGMFEVRGYGSLVVCVCFSRSWSLWCNIESMHSARNSRISYRSFPPPWIQSLTMFYHACWPEASWAIQAFCRFLQCAFAAPWSAAAGHLWKMIQKNFANCSCWAFVENDPKELRKQCRKSEITNINIIIVWDEHIVVESPRR